MLILIILNVVVRQGDDALNWFVVINGSLDVRISPTGKAKVK